MFSALRIALRSLTKTRGFTFVAVFTLALGIGANTAIFSAVHTLLLSPLPFKNGDELVSVQTMVKREAWERRSTSVPDFLDYRRLATGSFSGLAAVATDAAYNLTGTGDATPLSLEIVSHDYFPLLGVQAALGRTFTADEDSVPDRAPVFVLTDELWRSRFGANPAILGQQVNLSDRLYTVVGVMPPGFRGLSRRTQGWIPLAMCGPSNWEARGRRWHEMIGRLKPGATVESARTELAGFGAQLASAFPKSNENYAANLTTLRDEFYGELRRPLLVLMGAVVVVLAITCANVANLLLVRFAGRRQELAVRTALGASPRRLAGLFLGESALLALAGGGAALLLASWLISALGLINPVDLPPFAALQISWPVFGFSLALTLACAVGIGGIPALLAARLNLNAALNEAGRGSSAGASTGRLRHSLVIAEIALSLALLVTAALLTRSFVNLLRQNPGYRTEQLLTQRVTLPTQRYPRDAARRFAEEMRVRAAALPGVASAAVSSDSPLSGNTSATFATVEKHSLVPAENEFRTYYHAVSPEYFATAGLTLRQGENFAATYAAGAPPPVIISEALARRFWPSGNAVGQRFKAGRTDSTSPWLQIIGVVNDAKLRGLVRNPTNDPDMYVPFVQQGSNFFSLVVQTRGNSAGLTAELRALVRSMDANLPVYDVSTIEQRIALDTANQRFSAVLMGGFAVTALVLAAVGLYGVVSFGVAQRTREIGVRMALGARPGDILHLVVGGTGRLVVIGLAVGLLLVYLSAPLFENLLFQISPRDPVTYAAVAVLLALVALAAAWLPARRAAQVDPLVALRSE